MISLICLVVIVAVRIVSRVCVLFNITIQIIRNMSDESHDG